MIEKSKIISLLKTPIAIIGLGVSGEAALALLLELGIPRSSIATYDKKASADFSDDRLLINSFCPKTLVISPGVPLSSPWIQEFMSSGGLVTSELELATRFLTTEKIIAVTGSVGKSTVVSILGVGVHSFSLNSFFGGNLGTPLARYSLELLRGRSPADFVILELSSYQLENYQNLTADFGAIISLTPNHLERYSSVDDYYKTKCQLIDKTKGPVVCNRSGGSLEPWSKRHLTQNNLRWTDRNDPALSKYNLYSSRLLGAHNQDNLAVAIQLALLAGWPSSSIESMKMFSGLPHRLENLGEKNQVHYVNDSKATTIASVMTAIQAILPVVQNRIHVLLGGRDKNLPWEDLGSLRSSSKLQFYFFGECAEVARHKSTLDGPAFTKMKPAIEVAVKNANARDYVLLSPGGTSLDEFPNFEVRGENFRKIVESL